MHRLRRPRLHDDSRLMLRLALPAFAALVSEPLFLLADTAVVGFLGSDSLAALTVAATIVQTVIGSCVFLAYATTASVSRRVGAGDSAGAAQDGLAGLWLALGLGAVLGLGTALSASAVVGWFDVSSDVGGQASDYVRLSALGVPAMLLVLAATGVLRGLQDTWTPLVVVVVANLANIALDVLLVYGFGWGLAGSAIGTVLAQTAAALALTVAAVRAGRPHHPGLRPRARAVLGSAWAGLPLLIRTLTLRGVLVAATAVAATLPQASLAAQQITVTVVTALAYALDAVAIAAQTIIGRYLGAGDVEATRRSARRMAAWGLGGGTVAALGLLAVAPWLPYLFTADADVRTAAVRGLVVAALVQPLSGVVFVLDGVLIGAGDGRYLALAGLLTAVVYLPAAWAVVSLGGGIGALWAAYGAWMLARAGTLIIRARGGGWLRTGAVLGAPRSGPGSGPGSGPRSGPRSGPAVH